MRISIDKGKLLLPIAAPNVISQSSGSKLADLSQNWECNYPKTSIMFKLARTSVFSLLPKGSSIYNDSSRYCYAGGSKFQEIVIVLCLRGILA